MYSKVFEESKRCLLNIPEIVSLFRKQMFFRGNSKLNQLVGDLEGVTEFVLNAQNSEFEQEEWFGILECVVLAQQNKDYVMVADVLESDLLPFLQKVQIYLQENECARIEEYWEANVAGIMRMDSCLYDAIMVSNNDESQLSQIQYEPMLAINGQPTLKVKTSDSEFYMHSTVNPEWEAKMLADSWIEVQKHDFRIYGMGMGYHIKALLDADERNTVTVLENQIKPLMLALSYVNWSQYLMDGRLKIVFEADLSELLKCLEGEGDSVFFLHYPSLLCVEQREIRKVMENYFISVSSMQEQGDSLRKNFEILQQKQLPECGEIQAIFEGKTVVIVAGGPSLDDELENLKKFRNDILILSVGTAVKRLVSSGVYPDAIIITDPQDTMYHQIEGVELGSIPMLLLATASKAIVSHFHGPIYLVYQKGFELSEAVAREKGYQLFETGGSVTTTALDVSIKLGATEIVLVGADMAYTDNRSHAGGMGRGIKDASGLRQVEAVDGGMVYTSKNLDTYRKWIERRIAGLQRPLIYNTSRGARIAGTVEMSLDEVMRGE